MPSLLILNSFRAPLFTPMPYLRPVFRVIREWTPRPDMPGIRPLCLPQCRFYHLQYGSAALLQILAFSRLSNVM
ncbi:hypothetical protein BD309DRAFT_1012640, partial [Dichomitus squalens]